MCNFTSGFCCFVVRFTNEFVVLHKVELVASIELSLAKNTGETVEVVNVVLSSPNDLRWRDALLTARTLRTVPSETNDCR